jgi:hypothetical protein
MKVPSTILKAMVISAAIGITATGCKTRTAETNSDKTFLEKIFKANDNGTDRSAPDSCPACGMG